MFMPWHPIPLPTKQCTYLPIVVQALPPNPPLPIFWTILQMVVEAVDKHGMTSVWRQTPMTKPLYMSVESIFSNLPIVDKLGPSMPIGSEVEEQTIFTQTNTLWSTPLSMTTYTVEMMEESISPIMEERLGQIEAAA